MESSTQSIIKQNITKKGRGKFVFLQDFSIKYKDLIIFLSNILDKSSIVPCYIHKGDEFIWLLLKTKQFSPEI